MTREEELKGLQAMYEEIASIPDDEIFDYFYKNSPSFRNDFLKFATDAGFSTITMPLVNVNAMANNCEINIIQQP